MAEDNVQANIRINVDTAEALASIKNLQRQISAFHTSMANGSAANAASAANFQKTLIDNINATKKFSATIQTVRTTTETFTNALEKNKLSLGQYFRYAGGASKTFGRTFATEFETINKVARERVKDLQTQYIRMGRDASGAMKAIAVRPLVLDMENLETKTAIAAQRQQLFNQLVKQGSTNLLNFGKNTQWAGRQLMVGFTIPLSIFGTTAAKSFMTIEEQAIKFRRVYGDLMTSSGETDAMLESIKELASEFTKYGVQVDRTMGLAAQAAAQGKTGADLTAQVSEATRLAVLGQVEQEQALETTISVTNAFGVAAEDLAGKIDFLNAVENQTVTSIEDLTVAIPKAGPVVKQLGGDVEDLAFFLTAMKEGGINASEGANALKSGLASLINPTDKASEMLAQYGINIRGIVERNKGDVKGTVLEFATALDKLDPLSRARAIEQLFGKFQFSRLSTLFQNVIGEGTQAQRVLELAGSTSQELAALSARELDKVSSSPMFKFKKAVEDIKVALAPVGEIFLQIATPVIEFGTKILNAFNNLDEKTKTFVTGLIAVVGGIGPVFLMTFGLLANGLANVIKGFTFVKSVFNKASVSSNDLGSQLSYMTQEQLTASAVAASLDQVHNNLIQTFTSEAGAIDLYTRALQKANQQAAAFSAPAVGRSRPTQKFASGGLVPGSGNKDTVPAMLTPGEFVVTKDTVEKNPGIIAALATGKVQGFANGGFVSGGAGGSKNIVNMFAEYALRLQNQRENMSRQSSTSSFEEILAPLSMRIGEARGIVPSQSQVKKGAFDDIATQYEDLTKKFTEKLNEDFEKTYADIKDVNERYRKSWQSAGKTVEQEVNAIKSEADRGVVRKTFGLDEDFYGTMPTMPRREGGKNLERARKSAFNLKDTGVRSYTSVLGGARAMFERRTGASASDKQMGHVFESMPTDISKVLSDPKVSNAAKKAGALIGATVTQNTTDGIKDITRQASPSREAYEAGENIGKGALQGIESTIDDARKVGRKSRRVIGTPNGAGGFNISRPGQNQSSRIADSPRTRTPRRASREGDLEMRQRETALAQRELTTSVTDATTKTRSFTAGLRNVSYVVSGLSGVALMFGSQLGDLGNVIFGASMAVSALTTAAEINAATGFISLGKMAEGAKGVTGFLGRMVNIGGKAVMTLGRFAGWIGLIATAIFGVVSLVNYINEQKEKERAKIEGLGDAATLTKTKLEALGSFFGKPVTNNAVENIGTFGAGVEPMSAEKRNEVQDLRENEDFQKEFGKDIKRLSTATKQEAIKTFQTISLTLFSQGYAKEQIQTVIDALKIEAGKTNVKFEVASIDVTTKQGATNFKQSANDMVDQFNRALATGKKTVKVPVVQAIGGGRGNMAKITYKEEIQTTKEYDQVLKTNSANILNRFTALQTMLAQGTITSKQYKDNWNALAGAIENGSNSADLGNAVFSGFTAELKKTNPEFAALLPAITGTGNQILVMQGLMAGAIPTVAQLAQVIADLKTVQDFESGKSVDVGAYANAVSRINKVKSAITDATKAQEKANTVTSEYPAGGDQGGDKKKSPYQTALEQIKANTKEIQNQINAFRKLTSAGYSTEKAFEMAKDPIIAAALASTEVGSPEWKALTKAIKESEAAAKKFEAVQKKTLEGATAEFDKAYGNVSEKFAAETEKLQLAFEKANQGDMNTITQAESDIAALEYKLDDYDALIGDIELKEEEVNKKYDSRLEALDKIEAANARIVQQQKAQLTIADALSQGDISAAAKAVQDARQEDAQARMDAQRTNIENARTSELGGITAGGKTRAQIEKEVLVVQAQIKKIEEETLEPAQERVRIAQAKLDKDIASLKVAGKTQLEWEIVASNIRVAKTDTDEFEKSINAALTTAINLQKVLASLTTPDVPNGQNPNQARIDQLNAKINSNRAAVNKSKGTTANDKKLMKENEKLITELRTLTGDPNAGKVVKKNMGGLIKRLAAGGFAMGTDTVPAMLTPGEFVVRKYAVENFGKDNLKAINNGTYSGESVYNYELNINMSGTNLSADDVAKTVMSKIRQIDSQRIRGNTL